MSQPEPTDERDRDIANDAAAAKMVIAAAERTARAVLDEERLYNRDQIDRMVSSIQMLSEDVEKLRGTLTMFSPKPEVQFEMDTRLAKLERTFNEKVAEGEQLQKRWQRRIVPTFVAIMLVGFSYAWFDRYEIKNELHQVQFQLSREIRLSGH